MKLNFLWSQTLRYPKSGFSIPCPCDLEQLDELQCVLVYSRKWEDQPTSIVGLFDF